MSRNKRKADIVREVSLESKVSDYLKNKMSLFIYGIAALIILMFIGVTAKNYFDNRDDKFLNTYYSQLSLLSMNTTGVSIDALAEEARSKAEYKDYLLLELSKYAESIEQQTQLLEEVEGDFKQLAQSRLYDINNMRKTEADIDINSSMIPEIWEYRYILSEINERDGGSYSDLSESIDSFIEKYNTSYIINNIYIESSVF